MLGASFPLRNAAKNPNIKNFGVSGTPQILCAAVLSAFSFEFTSQHQKNSRRLWRSRNRISWISRSVAKDAPDFQQPGPLPEKCPDLGRGSISCCQKIGEEFSSSVETCRDIWPSGSTGVERYGCIPRSAANNLGEIPQKMGASKPLF